MNFFFDNNLSPRIARALAELFKDEHIVVALRDKFEPNVTDVEWMQGLAAEGRWIVISGDRKIRKNSAEFHTFRNSPLVGFFMAKSLYKGLGGAPNRTAPQSMAGHHCTRGRGWGWCDV